MKIFFTCLFLLHSINTYATNYVLGQGYNVGSWNFSGYANFKLKVPLQNSKAAEIELDDIALFGQGRINQYLNPFFEIEYSGQPIWEEGEGAFHKSGKFVLERLYNNTFISDKWSLKLGKFLSPVGEWNQIHAPPLVATVNRPLTTFLNFSEFISGASLQYNPSNQWLPQVQMYYQPWTELLPKNISSRPVRYKNVSGINFKYGDDFVWQAGLSIQHAEITNRKERQTLYALDASYDFEHVKLSTQFFFANISGTEPVRRRNIEWGGYLQLVIPMSEQWDFVARGETFIHRDAIESQQNAVFGFNYNPHDSIIFKLEYLLHQGASLGLYEGVYGSFGVMF
jgi:hypothetical protein